PAVAADHITPVLDVPLTVAVNCCLSFENSVTLAGDTLTLTVLPAMTVALKLPVAVLLAASVTVAVKLNVPAAVGTPANSPFLFIAIPAGGVPAEMLQL